MRYRIYSPGNSSQCFLAAVFPCISCENREETCSIWQESRWKMVRIRCNEPMIVYSCRLWQIPVDSRKNRTNPATGSIHWNTATMKSRELHWNRPFPAVRVRPGKLNSIIVQCLEVVVYSISSNVTFF